MRARARGPDRYEQRVFTRRRRATRKFCKTKPLAGRAVEPAAAVPVTQGAAEDFCKTKSMSKVVPTSAPEAREGIAQDSCKTKPIPAAQSSGPVSVTVPGEHVSDNSCKTKPTDHIRVNPTPPQ